ncbi:MAG: hypothetical protein ACXADY_18910, partial [Candidatus Hodarchaeales archaeon]
MNDSSSPEIVAFDVDDKGTGDPIIFWAQVVDDFSAIEFVEVRINGTEHLMTYNGTLWIYSQPITFGEYITYQITNTSDAVGNYLSGTSAQKNYTCVYDTIIPIINAWEYDPAIGVYGAFRANVLDSWGQLDTVQVNVTEAEGIPRKDLCAVMTPITGNWQFINNTLVLPVGTFYYDIIANDTSGNFGISAHHQGFAPSSPSNDPPSVENITLSRSLIIVVFPVYSNCTLYLVYDFIDVENDSEGGTEIRWYKNTVLQDSYNDLKEIPENALEKSDQWYATVRPKDGQEFGTLETSLTITIQNTIPQVNNWQYQFNDIAGQVSPVGDRVNEFYFENEDIVVSYDFLDSDMADADHSFIQWFRRTAHDEPWGEVLMYENATMIPTAATSVGDEWYYQITPFDAFDVGETIVGPVIEIESRPIIHCYELVYDSTTEKNVEIVINVTNLLHNVETVECEFTFYDGTERQILGLEQQTGNWSVVLEIEDLSYLNTEVIAIFQASTLVSNAELLIATTITSNFTLYDKAAPRVHDAFFIPNDDHYPTELTFYAEVEEFGSGVELVTLYYYFEP